MGITRSAAPDVAESGLGPEFDEGRFRSRMRESDFAAELFVSPAHAVWKDGRYALKSDEKPDARTDISGVRFQAYDPTGEDLTRERQCQVDTVHLIQSLKQLRELPGLSAAVLGRDTMKDEQPIQRRGTRTKFGLIADAAGKGADDVQAARTSYRSIVRAIHRSGLIVEHPKKFDPRTGLDGLEQWGRELKLRRRRRWWPWLLLLLPLLLLRNCDAPEKFFGFDIEHGSLIVVVDKSGSMQSLFPKVQAEAKQTLAGMKGSWFGRKYANVVTYDGEAQSALGGLKELNDETEARLVEFLSNLQAGGGTNLQPALEIAAKEVAAHGEPTTLVIITDGQGDESIRRVLQDLEGFKDTFQGIEIVGHTLTPRLLTEHGETYPEPVSPDEEALSDLATGLDGRFGPRGEKPE